MTQKKLYLPVFWYATTELQTIPPAAHWAGAIGSLKRYSELRYSLPSVANMLVAEKYLVQRLIQNTGIYL